MRTRSRPAQNLAGAVAVCIFQMSAPTFTDGTRTLPIYVMVGLVVRALAALAAAAAMPVGPRRVARLGWLLNGISYYALLFATGQWQRCMSDSSSEAKTSTPT